MNTASLRLYDLLFVLSFNGMEWSDEEHLEIDRNNLQNHFLKATLRKSYSRTCSFIYVPTRRIDPETIDVNGQNKFEY